MKYNKILSSCILCSTLFCISHLFKMYDIFSAWDLCCTI